jgi:hypothetical protein
MSVTEGLAFIYICSQADTRTGIWKGCAKSLSSELGIPERTARDVLERMEHGDYIRRFAVPGRHSCYPILVHKFEITQGEHDGEQLNALESKSPAELAYFPREHDGEHGAAQRRSENRKERKGTLAAPPPSDPRYQPFVDFAYETFKQKHGQAPDWQGKDWKALKDLLDRNKRAGLEEMKRRWRNYVASTESFTARQGDALGYFATHFDRFIDGSIQGGTNGANRRGAAVPATPGKYRSVPVHHVPS